MPTSCTAAIIDMIQIEECFSARRDELISDLHLQLQEMIMQYLQLHSNVSAENSKRPVQQLLTTFITTDTPDEAWKARLAETAAVHLRKKAMMWPNESDGHPKKRYHDFMNATANRLIEEGIFVSGVLIYDRTHSSVHGEK